MRLVRDWKESMVDSDAASVTRHLDVTITRPAGEVYDYVRNPENLPEWAAGLGGSVRQVAGQWVAESPMGRVVVAFAPRNAFGVLDHDVTLPNGQTVRNPMRVIAAEGIAGSESGTAACLVVFTLRRLPGMSDADFASDAAAVSADLARLKGILEGESRP
jgi:hypothetical protein